MARPRDSRTEWRVVWKLKGEDPRSAAVASAKAADSYRRSLEGRVTPPEWLRIESREVGPWREVPNA